MNTSSRTVLNKGSLGAVCVCVGGGGQLAVARVSRGRGKSQTHAIHVSSVTMETDVCNPHTWAAELAVTP